LFIIIISVPASTIFFSFACLVANAAAMAAAVVAAATPTAATDAEVNIFSNYFLTFRGNFSLKNVGGKFQFSAEKISKNRFPKKFRGKFHGKIGRGCQCSDHKFKLLLYPHRRFLMLRSNFAVF
jgi:hypothetical protein